MDGAQHGIAPLLDPRQTLTRPSTLLVSFATMDLSSRTQGTFFISSRKRKRPSASPTKGPDPTELNRQRDQAKRDAYEASWTACEKRINVGTNPEIDQLRLDRSKPCVVDSPAATDLETLKLTLPLLLTGVDSERSASSTTGPSGLSPDSSSHVIRTKRWPVRSRGSRRPSFLVSHPRSSIETRRSRLAPSRWLVLTLKAFPYRLVDGDRVYPTRQPLW